MLGKDQFARHSEDVKLDIECAASVLGIACYVGSSLVALVSLFGTRQRGERAALALMAAGGTILAGVLIFRGVRAASIPVFNRFEALTCYALALSGAYLILTAYRAMRGIAGLLIPYAAVVLLAGVLALGMDSGAPVPVFGPWLALHALTAYAAYGVFTLASILAAAYLIQDSNLKRKRFGVVWERLPSLEALDHVMSRLVGVAFLLLTVSIMLGFALVRQSGGGEEWLTDPKVLATVAFWILLAVLVHLRASADRHGRGVALMAMGGLVCLLFAFVGVHLVATTAHRFLLLRLGVYGP